MGRGPTRTLRSKQAHDYAKIKNRSTPKAQIQSANPIMWSNLNNKIYIKQ